MFFFCRNRCLLELEEVQLSPPSHLLAMAPKPASTAGKAPASTTSKAPAKSTEVQQLSPPSHLLAT